MSKKKLHVDSFSRAMSYDDVHESIKTIIKYYGDCRKALKELHKNGYNVTESQLYNLKCGCHISAVEEYMPLSEFRKLKERKIRIICESLVHNNGSVMSTYRELKDTIPFLNLAYIEKVLYKSKRPDISDEYFKKDQYKKQEYVEPCSTLYEPIIGDDEVWCDVNFKDIKSDMYQISNYGRVRNKIVNRKVQTTKARNNYITVHLMCSDNFRKTFKIHQLVATAFVINKYNKPFVNHKDRNPSNNYYKNLEWCTQQENVFHSIMNNKFTGCDLGSSIRKRIEYIRSKRGRDVAKQYASYNNIPYVESDVCDFMFSIIDNTLNIDMKEQLIFNDLIYLNSVYIAIYTVNPISYISIFIVPNELFEELTSVEIRHVFNGRIMKVKEYEIFTVCVIINQKLDFQYWNETDIVVFDKCKMIYRLIPYDVDRYIKLTVDKIVSS